MVKIKCSWCLHEFEYSILYKGKSGDTMRRNVVCPKCQRTLPSSIKELTGNVTGASHTHKEYK